LAATRAHSLGVAGWIRNEADGVVTAAFEGGREQVESMVEWCRRGPPGADVHDVQVAWTEPVGDSGFRIG
jgi:acylphosphatase